jgi:hypothetical protein
MADNCEKCWFLSMNDRLGPFDGVNDGFQSTYNSGVVRCNSTFISHAKEVVKPESSATVSPTSAMVLGRNIKGKTLFNEIPNLSDSGKMNG